uniref:FKBP prolyl isomerase family member 15 n=1 Tax=Homo sapiens TaxID=9606 RepID=A0A8I5KUP6_HUMAN
MFGAGDEDDTDFLSPSGGKSGNTKNSTSHHEHSHNTGRNSSPCISIHKWSICKAGQIWCCSSGEPHSQRV